MNESKSPAQAFLERIISDPVAIGSVEQLMGLLAGSRPPISSSAKEEEEASDD